MKLLNKGCINDKQFTYLSSRPTLGDVKPRQFYLLPKIHKDRNKWPINERMPEGRPIVSDCGSETHRVSEYIDYFLQPLATSHEAYIKDTYDFIDKIRNSHIMVDIMVTGDITALYTNMQIDSIIRSVKDIFAEFPSASRPDEKLLELLEITLTRNDFSFREEIFQQICGTAMGKRYAPSLANIYLRKFDHSAKHGFHIKPRIY